MFNTAIKPDRAKIDWLMLAAIGGLMIFGVLFVYSATMANESSLTANYYLRQMFFYALGLGVGAAFCLIDYHIWSRWALVFYWLTIILLVLVLIPGIGTTQGWGARRWIKMPLFQLQPSEFAKLSLIFVLAHFLSRPIDELKLRKNFFKALGLTALPFLLILKEPDLGSALVLWPMCFGMLYVAGAPKKYLFQILGLLGGVILLLWVDVTFTPPVRIPMHVYQKKRLVVFFNADFVKNFAPPNATEAEKQKWRAAQRDDSYNSEQALISVGSGGLMGEGWCQGAQNVLGFLPRSVAHNDFIFSVLAEEKGFVGSVLVITLYSAVLFCGIRIAGEARDRLGKLLAVGVVMMLFSHVFINIGMNIRIMPVTGVPLPLLSYGGSSVLCSLVAIGILQNVYIYRRSY
jgi:rod shape determining protein RodA